MDNEFVGIGGFLSRLDKVRKTGNGRFLARCPAHDDKSPSLSIRESDDGRVLLHCFGGCEASDVLAATGLEFINLIPDHLRRGRTEAAPNRYGIPCHDILKALFGDATLVRVAAGMVADGHQLTPKDLDDLSKAIERMDAALMAAGGARR